MPDDKTPPATTPPADDNAGLRATIAAALGDLLGSGKAAVADDAGDGKPASAAATRKQRDASVTDDVRQAIRDVNAENAKEDRITGLLNEVNTLKAAVQKPPRAVRKIERIMGWHNGDED